MNSKGHTGLALILSSLAMKPYGVTDKGILLISLTTFFSTLPDIDLSLQRDGVPIHHRGPTHSVLFGVIAGLLVYALFLQLGQQEYAWYGFLGCFFGVLTHLLGDLFTHHSFEPLWPFLPWSFSLGLFSASNLIINWSLLIGGVFAFTYYLGGF